MCLIQQLDSLLHQKKQKTETIVLFGCVNLCVAKKKLKKVIKNQVCLFVCLFLYFCQTKVVSQS